MNRQQDGKLNRVLLLMGPPENTAYPNMTFATLANFLHTRDIPFSLLDMNIAWYKSSRKDLRIYWEREFLNQWNAASNSGHIGELFKSHFSDLFNYIENNFINILYFFTTPLNVRFAFYITARLKEKRPDLQIFFGGPGCKNIAWLKVFAEQSDSPNGYLIGDQEESLYRILQAGLGEDLKKIPGILLNKENEKYSPYLPMRKLDKIPIPDYTGFDLDDYTSSKISISGSRGCPFRCAHCSDLSNNYLHRVRSPKSIIRELKFIKSKLKKDQIVFEDLVLNGGENWLKELCDLIIDSNLNIEWEGRIFPDRKMNPGLYKRMRDSGCSKLNFDILSVSPSTLDLMNVPLTPFVIQKNLEWSYQAGIQNFVKFKVGFPGETENDYSYLASFIVRNKKYLSEIENISPFNVLQDSEIEKKPDKFGIILPEKDHWKNWHDGGYNNLSYRIKKTKEILVLLDHLEIPYKSDVEIEEEDEINSFKQDILKRYCQEIEEEEVLLATVPPWGTNNPPVGLGYLAAYLDKKSIPYSVKDFNIELYNCVDNSLKMLWHVENKNFWSNENTFEFLKELFNKEINRYIQEIRRSNSKIIGFSVVDPKERLTIELITKIREKDNLRTIILGGPACFTPEYRSIFEKNLGSDVDGYVIGEGEEVLHEVVKRIRENKSLDDVPGFLVGNFKKEKSSEKRTWVKNIDTLPFPKYQGFAMESYHADSLILEWSRGCIGNCAFCKGKELTGSYRSRKAENIVEELKYHIEKNNIYDFTICDSVINGNIKELEKTCDLIIQAKLDIKWRGQGLPIPTMSYEILKRMRAAGCVELQWGLESGSDKVLELMRKIRLFNTKDAERVIKDCHRAGIKTCLFIIIGFPGETEKDFNKTVEFIKKNKDFIDQIKSINSLHIITDTYIHKHPDEFNVVLPEKDYHYLWYRDDNDIETRNNRIRVLLDAVSDLNIEVLETNLREGKQYKFLDILEKNDLDFEEKMQLFLHEINDIEPVGNELKKTKKKSIGKDLEDEDFVIKGILNERYTFTGPEILEIELTNNCNLSCLGCWCHSHLLGDLRLKGKDKRREIPFNVLMKLIDDVKNMGIKTIQLSGAGEPLLYSKFKEIVGYIKDNDFECQIITNFSLCDDELLNFFVDKKVDNITASIWAGDETTYVKTHPGQTIKDFLNIKENLIRLHELKKLKRIPFPKIKMFNVISNANANNVKKMVDFALETGVEFIEFSPLDTIKGKTEELMISKEEQNGILSQLKAIFDHENSFLINKELVGKTFDEIINIPEQKEFTRFLKTKYFARDFNYFLSDIDNLHVVCPKGYRSVTASEDLENEVSLKLYFDESKCQKCSIYEECEIDNIDHSIKAEYLMFLGFGTFARRILDPNFHKSMSDKKKVDSIPCYVGWDYARIVVNGDVIPCCKAHAFPLGNLNDISFKEIWNSDKYNEFREKAKRLKKSNPYFKKIPCYKACDNIGMNMELHERCRLFKGEGI